jgi:hypothetical protein
VIRPFLIPPMVLLVTVACIVIGELACGTGLYFTSMMAITLSCAGITYNLLGGLSSISGIIFTFCSVHWVVLSQFAKVVLLQRADAPLAAPDLTASVYALFYFCVMIGVFVFGRFRLRLPRPLEAETAAQGSILYTIALTGGLVGTVLFQLTSTLNDTGGPEDASHSAGVGLTALLLFAVVIAVDNRIRSSGGLHSFNLAVLVPAFFSSLAAFSTTERGITVFPVIVYCMTCYFRGYRFRLKHYMAILCLAIVSAFFLFPLESYSRQFISNKSFTERLSTVIAQARDADWTKILSYSNSQNAVASGENFEDYYNLPGDQILNRNSLIRADSNLIRGSANYHYGFTGFKQDFLFAVPRFIYKDKPEYGSSDLLAQVAGVSVDVAWNPLVSFSLIADSFGAFGWLGVIVVSLFLLPVSFVVFDSVFDITRPWGTVAVPTLMIGLSEASVGRFLITDVIRGVGYIILLSYAVGFLTRMIPTRGDSAPRRMPLISQTR